MPAEVVLIVERAETDMLCDRCIREITEGEDFFYDRQCDEMYCEECATIKLDRNPTKTT